MVWMLDRLGRSPRRLVETVNRLAACKAGIQSLRESGLSRRFKNEFGRHLDRSLQAAVDRTLIRKDAMHASGSLAVSLGSPQTKSHVNTADHEHMLLQFDLAHCLSHQASGGRIDLTRLQRASKGSYQSTRSRSDDVIEGGGTGLRNIRGDFIVLGDRAVDAKDYRFRFGRQICFTNRSFHTLDPHFRTIYDL